ncbi:alpha-amylase family glycosyl hydrolase [Paracoccus sp. TK19116]|uniref:Alpha-amylase family glycosyl hydrolase n=1 Tax=Paracoccus albicereus TaxID=2922394 RepID=A0ABT1MX42_9RHOB|nr:alpha-amylase family glycosyl hydrolase [Paracoccus albicereus]MCQ0971898.1 alpha-amylase family glycosyl hydrolase [Paracoccus albicereus]
MSEWWKGSVTYQVYPRSFQDDDGDGIGDLKGITRRLDHIAGFGVDAVWLSPVFTSPMADMGYDVSDYRDIDPVFGTLADFDALVARAHDLGLKVIIDQVISHSSDQHPFFAESRASRTGPKADWYVWADPKPDGTPPNNWLAIFGGSAWTWDTRRRQYYFHNFLPSQPDFNFHNPEVQDWHLDTMRFWLDRGVDGFRLDTVNYYFHDSRLRDDAADYRIKERPDTNPYEMQYHLFSKNQPQNLDFLRRMRAVTDEYDARMMVGEVGDSHDPIGIMGAYTTGGRLHQAYSFEMLGPQFTPAHFRDAVRDFFADAPGGWPCWAFSNHDVRRHVSRWAEHGASREALAKQAAALLLSLQGSVCLYQGEELGQTETDLDFDELTDPAGINFWPEEKGRDGCRTPMVWEAPAPNAGFSVANRTWLPVKPEQAAVAVDMQGEGSVLDFYRRMLALRRGNEALRTGATEWIDAADPVLAFRRGASVACVFNLSPESVETSAPEGEILLAEASGVKGDMLALGPNGFALIG